VRDAHAVAISPNGSLLACGAMEAISIYNLETGEEPRIIDRAHGADIFSLSFTPAGKQLASGGGPLNGKAELRLWNVEDGTMVREFTTDEKDAGSSTIALSSGGRLIRNVRLHMLHLP
jgi:WD40 repeat protein